jgi:thiamine transport system substrate-binding protein
MNKRLVLLFVLVVLVAGCGRGRGATAVPQQGGATPIPTGGPTAAPTNGATAEPAGADATSPLPTPGGEGASPLATPAPEGGAASGRTLRVMTHDSFSVSAPVVAAFQQQCGCQVQFLKSGDAGLALNKAILSKDSPLADVFYGVDNTFMSRALAADIFEPYDSPALANIPAELKLDPSNRLLPVDYGYVTLNYDKKYFADNNLSLPQSLRDLTKPEYKSLLAVENPATSSPGLAFLLATVAAFGESGDYSYLDFWRDLRANDVYVAEGWEDAYNTQFSAGSGKGDRPLVVSYTTSPAAEVYFADPQPAESPTGNLLLPSGSFKQVEFVGVLKGAQAPELARQWVDFMLGGTFQPDIPLQMWVYPAATGAALPEVFTKHSQAPADAVQMPPDQIEAGREQWLKAWTDTVLR